MPHKSSGLSPIEIFYNTKSDHSDLKMARCWGCPAYVLDPTLQLGRNYSDGIREVDLDNSWDSLISIQALSV